MSKLSYFDARRLARAIVREQNRSSSYTALPSDLQRHELDATSARPWIRDALRDAKAHAKDMGMEWSVIVSRRRTASIVEARHEIVGAIRRRHPHLSLTDMGALFNRDHASIINALRRLGFYKEAA